MPIEFPTKLIGVAGAGEYSYSNTDNYVQVQGNKIVIKRRHTQLDVFWVAFGF